MSKLSMIYFSFGGRAEAVRMAFYIRGIECEDVLISWPKWYEIKASGDHEWSGIPMLTISDAKSGEKIDRIGQSNAILRYAGSCPGGAVKGGTGAADDDAKENKDNSNELYPRNNALDCLRIDEILDAVEDLTTPLFSVKGDTQEERKKQGEEAYNKTMKMFLLRFNEKLERNRKRNGNDKIKYIVGNSITIADLKLYCHLKIWINGVVNYVDKKWIMENKELSNLATFYQLMSKEEKIIAFEKDFEKKVEKYKAAEAEKQKK